ncbi:MAG: hypothetical protein ABIG63_20430 [Chloroflexota bacterium]
MKKAILLTTIVLLALLLVPHALNVVAATINFAGPSISKGLGGDSSYPTPYPTPDPYPFTYLPFIANGNIEP